MNQGIGKRIQLLRIAWDIPQWELAHHLSMSSSRLSMIERNRAVPAEEELVRLRTALNWTPECDAVLTVLIDR